MIFSLARQGKQPIPRTIPGVSIFSVGILVMLIVSSLDVWACPPPAKEGATPVFQKSSLTVGTWAELPNIQPQSSEQKKLFQTIQGHLRGNIQNPDALAEALIALASDYENEDLKAQALKVYEWVIPHMEEKGVSQVVGILQMAGDLAGDLGDNPKKIAYYESSVFHEEKALGKESHILQNDLNRLTYYYQEYGEKQKLVEVLNRMVADREQLPWPKRSSQFGPLFQLGKHHESEGQKALANWYYEQAKAILDYLKAHHPDDIYTKMLQDYPSQVDEALARTHTEDKNCQ
jgi:hypothetical protein